jgi:SAM-dependent methyltransferase
MTSVTSKWPKHVPPLTPEQERIKEDWMQYWLGVLPGAHGSIVRFNHQYPMRASRSGQRVLEIGAGLGEHLAYEDLSNTEYHAVELLPEMAEEIRRKFPKAHVITGSCEDHLPFADGFFDRAVAIHVLEHLRNLPVALREIHRTLRPGGDFCVVIPCEGGVAYGLGRRVTSKRLFEKRYGVNYDPFIRAEHVSTPREIMDELAFYFDVRDTSYFPLKVPSVNMNLLIGLILTPRAVPGGD